MDYNANVSCVNLYKIKSLQSQEVSGQYHGEQLPMYTFTNVVDESSLQLLPAAPSRAVRVSLGYICQLGEEKLLIFLEEHYRTVLGKMNTHIGTSLTSIKNIFKNVERCRDGCGKNKETRCRDGSVQARHVIQRPSLYIFYMPEIILWVIHAIRLLRIAV